MIYFLYITLFLLMLAIAYEDFSQRAVHWFLFPLTMAVLLAMNIGGGSVLLSLKGALVNSAFILLQLCMVSIYFSLKERKWVNIFKTYFGLGDLLFLLVVTPCFGAVNFIFFYVSSLILVALLFTAVVIFRRNIQYQIPLAGMQAVIFLLLFAVDVFSPVVNLQDDLLTISYLPFILR